MTDQLLDKCQPNAGALIGAAVLALDAVKPVENTRQFSLGNSNTGITDGQQETFGASQRITTSIRPCKVNLNALERDNLSSNVRQLLTLSHRNSLRLLRLVNTLLDFSRVEAGRIQASYEPVDLPKLTAEIASNFGD